MNEVKPGKRWRRDTMCALAVHISADGRDLPISDFLYPQRSKEWVAGRIMAFPLHNLHSRPCQHSVAR